MTLFVSPSDDNLRSSTTRAMGWLEYLGEVRGLLDVALAGSSDEGQVELGAVLVPPPSVSGLTLPGPLRNGATVTDAEAVHLLMRMLGGEGFYARVMRVGYVHVQIGWDATLEIHLPEPLSADVMACLGSLTRADVTRERSMEDLHWVSRYADTARFDVFASELRSAAKGGAPVLLMERWAYGYRSARWWMLSGDQVDGALSSIRPRSLLSMAVDPALFLPVADDDGEDFVAFKGLTADGALDAVRSMDFDGDFDFQGAGYAYAVADDFDLRSCAVVPDEQGIVRADWDTILE